MYKIHSKTNFLRATALEQHTKYSIHDLNDKLCFGFDWWEKTWLFIRLIFKHSWSSMYCFETRESYGMRNWRFSQGRWREFKPSGLWDISQSTRLNKSTWRLKLWNGHYQLSSAVNATEWSVVIYCWQQPRKKIRNKGEKNERPNRKKRTA